jgi:N-glycosylase/DNA lyase
LDVGRLPVHLTEIAAPDFDLEKTLDSGQVFHWEKMDNGFCGTISDVPIYVEQHGDTLLIPRGRAGLIRNYFALDHLLTKICHSFPNDAVMNAARDFCRGLRILRQPKWECLATFICSSMKQVAHIRQISHALRRRFGQPRKIRFQRSIHSAKVFGAPRAIPVYSASPTFRNFEVRAGLAAETAQATDEHTLYTFPSAKRIAKSSGKELRECALGYRAKNLLATARLVANGDVNLEKIAVFSDTDLRAMLCELPGVGTKVANCVMLFAYERLRAFPVDVWIGRVLKEKYFSRARKLSERRLRRFSEEYFGEYGGYAQQYLFHHARIASRKPGRARDFSTALRSGRNDRDVKARTASRNRAIRVNRLPSAQ